MVSAEQFEEALARAKNAVKNPQAGLCGPDSMFWHINRETVVLLGGGAAALLQLAHPFVAHAVREHSRVHHDVAGRFRRTFVRMLTLVFGDLDSALSTARRVRAIHDRARGHLDDAVGRFASGTAYSAHDAEAVSWVHATLLDTALRVYGQLVCPLSAVEIARYYESSKPVALLFGLLPEQLPPDYAAFQVYYQAMLHSSSLGVGSAARDLAAHILTPPNRSAAPLYRFIRAYTAALLPEPLRQSFALPYGFAERALLQTTMPIIRASLRLLPPSARYFPAYLDAQRRLSGERGIDVASHRLSRRALRLLRPSFELRDLLY